MWIKRSTYEKMQKAVKDAEEKLIASNENLVKAHHVVTEYRREIEKREYIEQTLRKHRDELHDERDEIQSELDTMKLLMGNSDTNEVCLRIADDLTNITPIVRWKDNTKERLIQIGALSDAAIAGNANTAVQVALMTIASEALEQVIEGFAPAVAGGE